MNIEIIKFKEFKTIIQIDDCLYVTSTTQAIKDIIKTNMALWLSFRKKVINREYWALGIRGNPPLVIERITKNKQETFLYLIKED